MQTESVRITDLHPDPANARRHPQRNLDAIISSLARFGQQKPIVVDAAHIVRAGNGTLAAAKALGWTHIKIIRTELSGIEAAAFAIADNRTAELAEWDPDVLGTLLLDPEIGDIGFSEDELKEWTSMDTPPQPDEPQAATEVGESFQVIVDCGSEARQRQVFDQHAAEGLSCRLLTL
jgi:ParB-like chromosome segregation protein Spo0J